MSVFLYKGTKNNLKTLNSHVSGTLPGLSSANASSVFETASSVSNRGEIFLSYFCLTVMYCSLWELCCVYLCNFNLCPLNSLNMCC